MESPPDPTMLRAPHFYPNKYRVRSGRTPSPTWKAFLKNHVNDLVSIDFFIVSTIRFKLLFVLVVLAHSRRKVLHFNVTENPTA
jgi:putative transposase